MPASEREMKIFTVEEANALLPRVRKIVSRIQRAHKGVVTLSRRRKKSGGSRRTRVAAESAKASTTPLSLSELTLALTDLEVLGVQLKDFERGLVDFPSFRDGRMVLLCWQMGEGDELEWWHDVDSGFAGRTPL